MTQLGHGLMGIAIGILALPRLANPPAHPIRHTALSLGLFALLANIPDIEVSGWGHDRYYVSHSLFANLALISIVGVLIVGMRLIYRRLGGWRVLLGGALAWLSHLLLDSFYNHGQGVGIFWPLSTAKLALPLPFFAVVTVIPPPITPQLLHELFVECVFYGVIVMLASMVRGYIHCDG